MKNDPGRKKLNSCCIEDFPPLFLEVQRNASGFSRYSCKVPPLLSRDLIISPILPLFKDEALLSIKRGR